MPANKHCICYLQITPIDTDKRNKLGIPFMKSKTNWEEFFDGHAPVYNQNCFTKNTIAEVDFLIEALDLKPGAEVLDVACGTGRHSIELARRGYRMTGVDLSEGMLQQARKDAEAAGVQVCWRKENATAFKVEKPFDGVLSLCEGAFGLLGLGDDPMGQPLAILRCVAEAMKPRTKGLFTVLNGLAMVRRHTLQDVEKGVFDPHTMTEVSDCAALGLTSDLHLRERAFVPTELMLLFPMAGLKVVHLWGGTAGNWGRRNVDLDEMEIMVLAEKPA